MESKKYSIIVYKILDFRPGELEELATASRDAINAGMGFGWNKPPSEEKLKAYWKGVLLVPNRWLLVGKFDGVIAGSIQVVKANSSNEAASFRANIDAHFVATWARGHGLARKLMEEAEKLSVKNQITHIILDVRDAQTRAIRLYEQMNYSKWGTMPIYHKINEGKIVSGSYYYKELKKEET